jgi:hypothetical protein
MKTFIQHNNRLLAALLLVSVLAACEKDTKEEFKPVRLFAPGRISATPGETRVKLEWDASLYATDTVTYVVEVSKDSLFAGTPVYTTEVKTDSVIITDQQLQVRQKYFARVKAKGMGKSAESKWQYSPSFGILGEQFFLPIVDTDLKDKSVILKWKITAGLNKILIGPISGVPTEILLDGTDQAAGQKLITGLTAQTSYLAEIYMGTVSKGILTFTTKEPSIYTVELSPTESLVNAVANAANGDVIGLKPGTYNCQDAAATWVNLVVTQKSITIQSTSNNPADTKVNYKEITLKGTGAGITLKGIDFDGAASTAGGSAASYFLNLVGLTGDGDAATFTNITADNCIIRNMGNCLLRGNRAANNAHKIGNMKFNNCRMYDCQNIASYTFFTMEKMEFTKLEITNSTLYNIGRAFIGWSTAITMATPPTILIDHCTMNNFGREGRNNFFIDAVSNPVVINLQNSIIANTPHLPAPGGDSSQTVGASLVRASGAITSTLANSNTYKLNNALKGTITALTWPAVLVASGNKTVDPGWATTATNFTLPVGSELRTSSSTSGPIGDPRWAQ